MGRIALAAILLIGGLLILEYDLTSLDWRTIVGSALLLLGGALVLQMAADELRRRR